MEFGTNTGRQGTFNPRDPRQSRMAMQRLRELEDEYGDRLQIGFSGETGLAKNDAHGWSRMLNAQTEAKNIRNIASGKGPVQIEYGGVMQSRTMPRSMEPLGMYADDERRRGEAAYAEASKAGWIPDEVKVQNARSRGASTEYLENRAKQSGTIAQEMADDADPWQRRREGLIDQGTADQAFNESYGRTRGTKRMQAGDTTQAAIDAKDSEMDLLLSHPLSALQRQREDDTKKSLASMEAIGRIFANPENYAAAGGIQGIMGAGRQAPGAPAPGEPAPQAEVPGVPPDAAAELRQELERRGIAATPENIATVWRRMNAQ